MTFLLIVGIACLALAGACAFVDRMPPTEPEHYPEPRHVRVLDDQERNA